VIIDIESASDERLHAFRWRERQLTTIAQRKSVLGEGMFIAEGDLVVRRALEAGCKQNVRTSLPTPYIKPAAQP
jgi:hypothetical protein